VGETMPDETNKTILSALRAYCHESNESFYTISRKMGVSYSALSRWMLEGSTPTTSSVEKIRKFIQKYGPEYW
jgi:DNA-binding transcriptional ArsR family regulator